MRSWDAESNRAEAFAEVWSHRGMMGQFFQQRAVGADQTQVRFIFFEPDPTESADDFRDVAADVRRERIFAIALQHVEHGLGGHARSGGVPEGKLGNAISVNVFGAAD
ncbi:hypothetical protein HRbin36_00527 [bacterium HR36]|nr:hypothetical protein HRbin36_00527 [bacterium HR36]